jgi:TonB family protein
MNTITAPIATTTSLSVLLHAAVIAVILVVFEQNTTTGRGVDVLLVSSTRVSNQHQTELARNDNRAEKTDMQPLENTLAGELRDNPVPRAAQRDSLISPDSNKLISSTAFNNEHAQQIKNVGYVEQKKLMTYAVRSTAQLARSTNARQQQHSLLELLHNTISNNKEYPYLARRQRREGIATVGFELHPDGSIKNTHLVASSNTGVLDRAALSAVKRIEPFAPARDYLEQAKEFSIDVVFKLL